MTRGIVNSVLQPLVSIDLIANDRSTHSAKAIVDTGFNHHLTLPRQLMVDLQFPLLDSSEARLADGNVVVFDVYKATVVWNGTRRVVPAYASDSSYLIGTALLYGSELRVTVVENGTVTITPLS